MRIARYRHNGTESFGFVSGEEIVDRAAVPEVSAASVRELLADGVPAGIDLESRPSIALSDVTLLVPLELSKVVCAGVNYPTHREEANQTPGRPAYPVIFTRFADSHVAAGEPLLKPTSSDRFDYEGELAVVIGKRAWQVDEAEALDYVGAYAPYNDGSVRDWQIHTPQWIPGKNAYRSGSIGPWLVTVDEVEDVGEQWLETRVNGEVRQRAQIKDMVFSIAELIAYVSTFTPLEPGDVIATGTPGGVGLFMQPPTFLKPGDEVEVEVTNVGLLRNSVIE